MGLKVGELDHPWIRPAHIRLKVCSGVCFHKCFPVGAPTCSINPGGLLWMRYLLLALSCCSIEITSIVLYWLWLIAAMLLHGVPNENIARLNL